MATLAGPEQLAAEPAATADLVRICGGSLLALRIAGARLGRRSGASVSTLVAELGDGRARLDLLAYEDLSVRASLAAGVGRWSAPTTSWPAGCSNCSARGRARRCTRPRTSSASPPSGAHRALDDLVDAHLAQRDRHGGYRLPTLVSDYAAELAAVGHVSVREAAEQLFDPWAA